MNLRVALIVGFCVTTYCVSAQSKRDSLWQAIGTSEKSGAKQTQANQYAQLAYLHINEGHYDSAIIYYKKSLSLQKALPEINLVGSDLNGIGTAYNFLGNYDSAIHYYEQSLMVYKTVKDTLHSSILETNLAIIYKNLAVYDKALQYAFSAIRRHEELGDLKSLSSSFSTVSLVYLKTKDYTNALEYAYKSLRTREMIKYKRGIGQSHNNLGEIFLEMRRYDSAIVHLNIALDVKRENNDRKSFASTLTNLGTAEFELGNHKLAEQHFVEGLAFSTEFKEPVSAAVCYNKLARISMHKKDYLMAWKFLDKSDSIYSSTNAPELKLECLEIRIKLSELMNKFPQALTYMREFLALKDSTLSREKAESMNALNISYETAKKEQQIVILHDQDRLKTAQINAKQWMIYGLCIGIFFLVAIAALVYYFFRVTKRNKEKLEFLNKELNHRVKNNLQLLASVLSLQSQDLPEGEAMVAVKSTESRVNAMAIIHRKLYDRDNSRSIFFDQFIHELVEYLLYSYSFRKDEIRLTIDLAKIEMDVEKAIPIGLILNEVISNCLKHAFHGQPDPSIAVMAKVNPAQELFLIVKDNGKGFVLPSNEYEHSFGLKMINLLTKELGGNIKIDTDDGTKVMLSVPLK